MVPEGVAHDFRGLERADVFARGRAVGTREWSKVVGLCWHQTASGHLHESHPKLLAIPAHILLHRSGRWSLLHPLNAYVQHGHALNGGTIGIEVDCRAAGVEGDASTFWRSAKEKAAGLQFDDLVQEATDEQMQAIPTIMRWCIAEVANNGGDIRANWAHRQGHRSRTTDPGSRIWGAVERAQAMGPAFGFQLADVRDMKLGSGKPIEQEWRTT